MGSRKWGAGLGYAGGYGPDAHLAAGNAPDPADVAAVEANIMGFRAERLMARGAGRAEAEAEAARAANAALAEADRAALRREKAARVAALADQLNAARAAKRAREVTGMGAEPEVVAKAAAPANGSCAACGTPYGKRRRCFRCRPTTRKFPRVASPEPAAEPEPVSVSPTHEVGPVPAVDVSLDAAAWSVARALVDALGREKVSAVLWAVADRLGLEA